MTGGNCFFCALNGSFKTERAVNELKVIINSLRYAYNSALKSASFYFICNIKRTTLRTVAADDEHHIYSKALNGIYNVSYALSAATASSKERTADFMNFVNILRI